MTDTAQLVLRLRNISKSFGGTRALIEVDLDVRRSEIHVLIGGNGSGKSTLIKTLAGVHAAEPGGSIEVDGRTYPTERYTAEVAKAAGLHFVHQTLGVFPHLSVAENLAIERGYERNRYGRIEWRKVRSATAPTLARFHIDARPETLVSTLRPAERAKVAIARALQGQEDAERGILVLDEPTASLPVSEVEALLGFLRRCAAAGQTILFVTHRLDEALEIADRVSVLRDGKRTETRRAAGLAEDDLVRMMTGRAIEPYAPSAADSPAAETFRVEVRRLAVGPLDDVSFSLGAGEILGIAGLLGSGRSELLHTLFGDAEPQAGEIRVDGRPVRFRSPAEAVAAGIALVPEDRLEQAAFVALSVRENVSAPRVGDYWRGLRLRYSDERRDVADAMRRYLVRAESQEARMMQLSGGNQQKVVLARWLRLQPRVLLLDDPTQGVDIAARREIHRLVRTLTDAGSAALVVSSDFEELAAFCDRVIVLSGGRVAAEVSGAALSADSLTLLCYPSVAKAS